MRKTKIICTLGPASEKEEILREMIDAGMDVARLNFSHGTHADHKEKMDLVKKLRADMKRHIAIMLDTKGPEIRLHKFTEGRVRLEVGQTFTLLSEEIEGDHTKASITYKELWRDVKPGTHILIDDGLIDMEVERADCSAILCRVINGGFVSDRKGINVPGVKLSLPFLSEKDKSDILFGVEQDVDFIAASFTQCAEDILSIRSELDRAGGHDIKIIAKIENASGVANIDEIINVSDGIMVARGDMGVEIPFEELPVIQKELIAKSYRAGKQVITATQMLESMRSNPRPTRAEATDVANAIYDGTSAIMLSGETAAGSYPVEAVKTMARLAVHTESKIDYKAKFSQIGIGSYSNVTSAISHATCTTAQDLKAAAIITVTKSGQTARHISKYRPETPIIGCSSVEKTCRILSLSWGVTPLLIDEKSNSDELFSHAVEMTYANGLVHFGSLVVITAGIPVGVTGTTNMLKVQIVGDVLATGTGIVKDSVCGTLCVCTDEDQALASFKDGDILVIPTTSNRIISILRHASGIVCERDGADSHAAIVGQTLNIPVIVGAAGATKLLKSGTTVTIDGRTGTVYTGNRQVGS